METGVEIEKTHAEVLVLNEKGSNPRLNGGSVQHRRGPRLDLLTLWAVRRSGGVFR